MVLEIAGGTNHDILRRSDWFLHGGIVAYLISPKREFESPFVAINEIDKPTLFPLASQSHIVRDISHEISLNPPFFQDN